MSERKPLMPGPPKGRRKTPTEAETRILVSSRRRCALCYGINRDLEVKKGQIAHLDRDPSNATPENLVFLCLLHHSEYDSRASQSKGLTQAEIVEYRRQLYELMSEQPSLAWPDAMVRPTTRRAKARDGVPLDLYDRRVRHYHAARELIGKIVANASIDQKSAWDFAVATDEALFLFDDNVAGYFSELYKKAIRLAIIMGALEKMPVGERRSMLVDQESEIVLWFLEQFSQLRTKLVPFLRAG